MDRVQRLFKIVDIMQTESVMTADDLAAQMQVSVRTIYRDIQALIRAGVCIEGEAGVGYRIRRRR